MSETQIAPATEVAPVAVAAGLAVGTTREYETMLGQSWISLGPLAHTPGKLSPRPASKRMLLTGSSAPEP